MDTSSCVICRAPVSTDPKSIFCPTDLPLWVNSYERRRAIWFQEQQYPNAQHLGEVALMDFVSRELKEREVAKTLAKTP